MPFNYSAFKKLVNKEFQAVAKDLGEEFTRVIDDPQAFADQGFTDQDIVDTGRLRDSQQMSFRGYEVKFLWNPVDPETGDHYARGVYSGFFAYGNARRYVPGRKWDVKGIRNNKPVTQLAGRLRRKGLRVRIKNENYDSLGAKKPGLGGPI